MIFSLVFISSLAAFLLTIWYRTEAFKEYLELFRLTRFFKVKEYIEYKKNISNIDYTEFLISKYNNFFTTSKEIQTVINFLKSSSITSCLEIETYTWEILPEELKLNLIESIVREYKWIIKQFNE